MSTQQLSLPWWDDDAPCAVPGSPSATPGASTPPRLPAPPAEAGPPAAAAITDHADQPAPRTRPAPASAEQIPGGLPNPAAGHTGGLAVFRHPAARHEVRLGHALVAFELKRVKRRSIGMVISPEGLSVRAPRWVGLGDIEQALRDKSRWICTKLDEQRLRQRREQGARIEWRQGATVPVLGEPVILVLDGRVSGAQLQDDASALPGVPRKALHVGLPEHASAEQIRDAVTAWLQRRARQVFEERVRHFAEQLGVRVSRLSLSSARTRWGSASADGSVRLHWRLIHFSPSIVDYVVAHELAHLREMNHSPRFWGVVRSVLPEYDAAREQLRQAVIPD